MNTSLASTRAATARDAFALKPLVLAILSALPLLAQAQAGARPPPAPNALPVPAVGWRVNGIGGTWSPTIGAQKSDAVITQSSQRAIYHWQSFDIGAASSLTYRFGSSDGAALNRVTGSIAPSRIFGRLASTVPGADGKAVPGGTLVLINQNGILFGAGAQVNTGALIASTLNVGNDDFLAGFDNSLRSTDPTFVYEGGPDLYADSRSFNFVRVDTGAVIETASGGRVFLFAKNVDNAGTIRTPGGQTVLAAGGQVFLNDPLVEKLYASEVNLEVPALRGLLVEVAGTAGRVGNTGTIEVPRGNATLVGMAVNQSGRISATTSVSENGSIFLLARGETTAQNSSQINKRATVGGELTLGAGSQLTITPDETRDATGALPTADSTVAFTTSRVELSARSIELQNGAAIVAPGGIVNARAEAVPSYVPAEVANGSVGPATDAARLVLGAGVKIDVAGTTSTEVSAARNFVTTELIGANDLKDSPLQRDGPLYRSKITFDVRKSVPILGDTSAYATAIQRSATEKMAGGGTVTLAAAGAVITDPSSKVDVSGGRVTYTEAQVRPTTLIAADGTRYSANNAPADITYSAVEGGQASQFDRWGRITQFTPVRSRIEAGYVDGRNGGTVKIATPIALLGGQIAAGATNGERQVAGTDTLAQGGAVDIGARAPNSAFLAGGVNTASGVLRDFAVSAAPKVIAADLFNLGAPGMLPAAGWISADTLNDSGASAFRVTSFGDLVIEPGAALVLTRRASLELNAAGAKGVTIGADITAHGGSVTAQTVDVPNAAGAPQLAGGVTLQAGSRIDVSGDWVNQSLDGARAGSAVAGGAVQLRSAHGLDLQDSSAIDVSGGATVGTNGTVTGTNAGSIRLDSQTGALVVSGDAPAAVVHIGADLRGASLAAGGSLRLRAAEVDIRDTARLGPRPPIRDGDRPGALVIDDGFFSLGGFTSFDIEGAQRLGVDAQTIVAPQATRWVATPDARLAATGSRPGDILVSTVLPEGQRNAVSLRLASTGLVNNRDTGALTLGRGATLATDAGASVTLSAAQSLIIDQGSRISAPGGKVALELNRLGPNDSFTGVAAFEVRTGATIDVSGKTVLQPTTNGYRQGQVFDGGSIAARVIGGDDRAPRDARIDLAAGARLLADGARDTLDISTRSNAGVQVRPTEVHSAGGRIEIDANDGGARVAATLSAASGGGSAADGSFALQFGATRSIRDTTVPVLTEYRIDIGNAPVTGAAPGLGVAAISARTLRDGGFADITLRSPDRIHFTDGATLDAGRSITLTAPVLSAAAGSNVRISAPGAVTLGGPVASPVAAEPPLRPDSATLSIEGGLVTFAGTQELRRFASVDIDASSRLQFDRALVGNTARGTGRLRSSGDLTLSAPQTIVTTATDFSVDAPNRRVTFAGGDATAAAPLSAGGALDVNAAQIVQGGVVLAPFGRIAFNATDSATLRPGSLTSVSGTGLTVPYGTIAGGADWSYNGAPVTAPTEKAITLSSPGQAVAVEAGARLGLAGGGDLLAQEFVPGPGGSRDVFTGGLDGSFAVIPGVRDYAPADANIAALATTAGAAQPVVGQQITLGAAGDLPAGTYAVLPARYATLPGAYLITPSSSKAALAPGYHVTRPDGAQLVAGQRGSAGTGYLDAQATGYVVRTAAQAKTLSEIQTASADKYFLAQAQFDATAVPRLTQDAGSLKIEATRIALAGAMDFTRSATPLAERAARGGEVDIAAERIVVADAGAAATAGTLVLSASQLNSTGAASVLLGGSRSAATAGSGARSLSVSAREVVLQNAAESLRIDDLILAATDQVTLATNAGIAAPQSSGVVSDALATVGDGALLRASADVGASVTRTGASRNGGKIDIGAGAQLGAAGLIVESTAGTTIAADAQLQARSLTLGAPRVALGNTDTTAGVLTPDATSLVIGPSLTAALNAAESLTLRSFSAIDIYGSTALGSASQRQLTLDAGAISVLGTGAQAQATSGGVRVTNTSGSVATASGGTGSLTLTATGANGGSGDVVIGSGAVALQGVADARLVASRSALVENGAALAAGEQLVIAAPTLIAAQSAVASVTAAGLLRIEPGTSPAVGVLPAGGPGANLTLTGARVEQAGRVDLASGRLDLVATGTDASPEASGIRFEAGSSTVLAGRSTAFDGVQVTTSGGELRASARAGNVAIDAAAGSRAAAVIDVSAGGAKAHAGTVRLTADTGAVTIGGALRAASADALGGTLAVDSRHALDLGALSAALANGTDATRANFAESISVRNRIGDQLLASGSTLKARAITISADAGGITIAGTLDASGTAGRAGGTVEVAARDNLTLASGGRIAATGTGAATDGGSVSLASRSGQIKLLAGGTVDTSAASGGQNGELALRATRVGAAAATASGNEVQVDPIASSFTGVDRIDVEAVKVYNYTANVTVNTALATTIAGHNNTFAGTSGTQANAILARLAGADAALRSQLHLRPGVEIRSTGDISVANDWNLTPFAANASPARPGGEPVNLTLRAAGNLNIQASISDGFRAGGSNAPTNATTAARVIPEATIVAGAGADLRLVGGADLGAASTLATLASTTRGDVVIGRANTDVIVRSTTGDIDIAAGRDVSLLNRQAVVYTTGAPVPVDILAGWVRPRSSGSAYAVLSGASAQSPMLDGSGSVAVRAERDVLGATAGKTQYGSNWWWRGDSEGDTGVVSFWSRYDKFRQGFGSLGGGDVSVSAGRDARNVQLAAGSSGYIVPGANGIEPQLVRFGAGSATLQADRNVAGGLAFADGPQLRVSAGNDIEDGSRISSGGSPYLQVLYGNAAVNVDARRNATLGRIASIGLLPATAQYAATQDNARVNFVLGGIAPMATLHAVATAGDLRYWAIAPNANDIDGTTNFPISAAIPSQALLAAPAGTVSIDATIGQIPVDKSELTIASRDSLKVANVVVTGASPVANTPGRYASSTAVIPQFLFINGNTPLQADGAEPVRLISTLGDVTLADGAQVAAPLRVIAGRDIVGAASRVDAQHQSESAVSLLQAGRDVNLPTDQSFGIKLHGPGDLVVLAGRNVDLATSQGFSTQGNRDNGALPAQSAKITIVAGVTAGDWGTAQARYFHLLGATGVAGQPGELVAQLDAAVAGQAAPPLGSAAAIAFDALPAAQRVDTTRQRVGAAAFDAALLTAMRHQVGAADLTLADARTRFETQPDSVKSALVGSVLANAWANAVPAAARTQLALGLAQRTVAAGGTTYGPGLMAYVERRTGAKPADLAAAVAAFATLPPESQLIFSNEVLATEVRTAGRAAAALTGEDRDRAYEKAYAAIDTVFPAIGTGGDLLMGVSQVKTLQGSDIVMMTPRGGINVGELAAGAVVKQAKDLGIVTTAGGGVSMIVSENVDVNQSRVFTVGEGDLLIWSGQGNIDAGRGAKTVTGAPPPVYRIVDGQLTVDTSGSFSGSGIAVLNADSTLDLYAPKGEINAGDAGIKSLGNAFLGALTFIGADNLAISGAAVGAPPPAATGGATAALAALGQSGALAATQINAEDSEEEKERKRRRRLTLILDFLGFGEGPAKP